MVESAMVLESQFSKICIFPRKMYKIEGFRVEKLYFWPFFTVFFGFMPTRVLFQNCAFCP